MSSGFSGLKGAACLCGGALLCAAFLLPFDCAAQGRVRQGGLPRVGTIKDYPATGLTVGCGNYYFHLPHEAGSPGAAYVFIARSDGDNAWMNLGGRDVRLQKTWAAAARVGGKAQPLTYRLGTLRVSVLIQELRPEGSPAGDDFVLKMTITLRRGRAARTVRAVGYTDC